MTAPPDPVAPALAMLRGGQAAGDVTHGVSPAPGCSLQADPGLALAGRYRSPPGRLLELEAEISGLGNWIALHFAVAAPDLMQARWLTLTCRAASAAAMMIRPCLRSGLEEGFVDCFFDKHILSTRTPQSHVDGLHLPTTRSVPETAPWRELVLFLPRESFSWHLHDLHLGVA